MLTLNGRQVFDFEIEGTGNDSCDYFFAAATYDDGTELSIDELDELAANYPEVIHDYVMEKLISKAESVAEGDR